MKLSAGLIQQVKVARKKFTAMAATYSLGVFNDNFFKQAAMLLAVEAGRAHLQGIATVVFAVPFLLFAAPAGWLADRYSKRSVIIGAKGLELAAMLAGAAGIYFMNWPLVFLMLFLMALQSAVFSPALNGSIPELYPDEFVTTANARLRVVVTAAILLGIVFAGFLLDQRAGGYIYNSINNISSAVVVNSYGPQETGFGRFLVAFCVVIIAILGLVVSFGVAKYPAADPDIKFPVSGPYYTIKKLISLRKDSLLLTIVFANAFFWFLASLQVQIINVLGRVQLGMSKTGTSVLVMSQLVGVSVGGLLAAKISKGKRWHKVLVPSLFFMTLGMIIISGIDYFPVNTQKTVAFILLGYIGIVGGVFMIPVGSHIQTRPAPNEKGTVWASSNFAAWSGMLFSGPVFYLLNKMDISSSGSYGWMSIVTVVVGFWLMGKLPRKGDKCVGPVEGLLSRFVQCALRLRYRIKIKGLDEIVERGASGIIILPNHPALIDPVIITTALYPDLALRPLADMHQIDRPFVKWFSRKIGALPIPSTAKTGKDTRIEVGDALNRISQGLADGENFLLYPSGSLLRSKYEDLGANSAIEAILSQVSDVRIVLVRTRGLWGSRFSWASGKEPRVTPTLLKGFFDILFSGIFFTPKRHVDIEFYEPADFPRTEDRDAQNRYMERFFNKKATPNTYVPYTVWERGKRRIAPEPDTQKQFSVEIEASQNVREIVTSYLKEATGLSDIRDTDRLANDLGLDSIALTDLLLWIEKEFGVFQNDSRAIKTVNDVLLAASGHSLTSSYVRLKEISSAWEKEARINPRVILPEGNNVAEVFLKQARLNPQKTIIADQLSGEKTYRDLVLGILVLKSEIEKIPGDYIGILLPASVGAVVVYLSVVFSGKIPVMVNWTVGQRNIKHSLDVLKIRCTLTSRKFIERLSGMGTDLSSISKTIVCLEDIRDSISFLDKIKALVKSRFSWKELWNAKISETAVVLFTSGSESLPKAVPLAHSNILANLRDAVSSFSLFQNDRVLGMLPPFHSFGLTITVLLPVTSGMKVVYYPNPTEGVVLSNIIELYKATVLVGTPTFLNGIVRMAKPGQLDSLRLSVTGAEKCSAAVYDLLEQNCPNAVILEGYGITECSPVVSANDEKKPVPGSIGKVFPSLEYVIVDLETGERVVKGQRGMLLVSGPSVFSGYLNYEGPSPFVEYEGKKWYKTGDLVTEDKNGILSFCGRLKRFVKIGGEMISLPAVEEVLIKYFGTEGAEEGPEIAVEATSDESRPELILFTKLDVKREDINNVIRQAGFSALYNIRRVVRLEEIPALGTGKTNYRVLKDLI